ncbi:hypothetical protein AQJ84_06830 [Streptomyces resistomycificus]|uniref:Uncharacterized protein n=2 Tax=Streptomyces resistomycificus TaxID=67356 RepID=A0A0L8L8H1_9ACTN|nr:hypothetical protein ADK37_18380 [Streptomyces resistomycificus]KUO00707.1 hypothetical protein AQJ84_06830 [Streptomyces resistomycificus]
MVVTSGLDYVTTGAQVDGQLRQWLKEPPKSYDIAAFAEGRNEIARGVTLDHDSATGTSGAYGRWRLRETAPDGTWQTTVLIRQSGDGPTRVQLDVEHLPDAPEALPVPAKTPRLAGSLLSVLDARDGLADVMAQPQVIEAEDVDDVVDELCDETRRLPIVVASTPYGVAFDSWLEGTLDPLVRPLAGLAVLYVLAPEAEPLFNRALEYHRVYGGGVRTYLPGVDPAWPADGQRHRVMSRRLLAERPDRARRILAQLPQRLAARTPLPAEFDSVPVMRARTRGDSEAPELERLRDENHALLEILEEAGREQRVRADEIRDLKYELRKAEDNETLLVAEYDEQYRELHTARRQLIALQKQLVTLGAGAAAYTPVSTPEDAPESFEELLDRMGDLPLLHFTGSRKIALELDAQAYGSSWVRMTWDALLALRDFAEAAASGHTDRDFRQWCADAPTGARTISPRKIVRDESKSVKTNSAWRRERTFPVPDVVDPARKVFMGAHVRVGGGNTIAPRLHYHDGARTEHGIYIGYIGPHLTNTLT